MVRLCRVIWLPRWRGPSWARCWFGWLAEYTHDFTYDVQALGQLCCRNELWRVQFVITYDSIADWRQRELQALYPQVAIQIDDEYAFQSLLAVYVGFNQQAITMVDVRSHAVTDSVDDA